MSKRAEERALEVYPVEMAPLNYQDLIDQFGGKTEIDINTYPRCLFQEGYEQAEKDLGWHSVEESLPPIDEEVIVLTDEMHGKKLPSACHISYGHRPNPEGWDGKSIFTGKVTHHDVITYDGWNIPGVKYWMPMPKLPKEE